MRRLKRKTHKKRSFIKRRHHYNHRRQHYYHRKRKGKGLMDSVAHYASRKLLGGEKTAALQMMYHGANKFAPELVQQARNKVGHTAQKAAAGASAAFLGTLANAFI